MRCASEPLRHRIEKNQRERYGREDARQPINCARGQQEPGTTKSQQNHGRQSWYEQVSRGRARVALIKRPVNEPVEKHGRRAREHHADNHQQKNSQRWPAVRRHDQRSKSKGERENRVRKTNQPKKSANWSGPKSSHIFAGSFSSEEHTLPACSCRQPCPDHLRVTSSEVRTEISGLDKLPRPAGFAPQKAQLAQLSSAYPSSRSRVGQRMLTPRHDAARAFLVRSAFPLAFPQAQAIRCGRRRAYRCAHTYAHQRNRVALAGDSLEGEQSDNCRNTPTRQKTRGPVRRT